jgi:DNA transformation protein
VKDKSENEIEKLSDLPNIGPEIERQLNQVGIFTYEDLKTMGAQQAWLQIQQIDSSACIHRLLALEGAIRRVKKSQLPIDVKERLKEFYHWNRK